MFNDVIDILNMLVGGLPFPPGFQGLKPCDLRLEILYFLRCTLQKVVPR